MVALAGLTGVGVRYAAGALAAESRPARPAVWTPEWQMVTEAGMRTGERTAQVQLATFVDFQCPACRSQHDALRDALSRYGRTVAVSYVHLPLDIHPFALSAAAAAQCAHDAGRLEDFVDAAFSDQESIGLKPWSAFVPPMAAAESLAFEACLQSAEVRRRVLAGKEWANRLGVRVTPTTIVNGWRISGVLSATELRELIRRASEGLAPALVDTGHSLPDAQAGSVSRFGRRARTGPSMRPGPVPLAITIAEDVEFDLTDLSQAHLLDDGRLLTFSEIGGRVLLFRKDGSPERVVARRGRGPGEFVRVANVSISHDTAVFVDGAAGKVILAGLTGTARERRIDAVVAANTDRVAGKLSDGALILHSSSRRPNITSSERQRVKVQVRVLDPDGTVRELMELDGTEYARRETRYRGRVRNAAVPVYLDGLPHVLTWDSLLVTVAGAASRIEVRDRKGRVVRVIEDTSARRPVTQEMRKIVREEELRRLHAPGTEPLVDERESERLIREAVFADSVAPFHSAHVSRGDRLLWVVDGVAPGDSLWTALAFRPDGTIGARAKGAIALGIPVDFQSSRVLLRHEDSDGEVSLRVHELVNPRR